MRLHRGEHPQPAAVRAVLAAIASGESGGCGEEAAQAEITHTIIRRSGMSSYESPSRRVSRESLGDWAMTDPLAGAALRSGGTEAELIHALLEDRRRLKELLTKALFTSPPAVVISEEAFKRYQARKGRPPAPIDEIDSFPDCGLNQEDARDELQRIERSL